MKKLAAALVSICLLCGGAAAAGCIENPEITVPIERQAQMLRELGLFRGTESGFELERAMTRAEAAVMLVRYLGAEKKVLDGSWKHPFSDVPAWADKYVGWLYQSGLTKGVFKTRYGASEPVTCEQYCIFLSRALAGDDNWQWSIAQEYEVRACDEVGFRRGDAAALSVRALSCVYIQYDNSMSMAQFLIDHDVFTTEQFKNAAWDVLPRRYDNVYARGDTWNDSWRLSCIIADVRVLRSEATDVDLVYDEAGIAHRMYGVQRAQDDAQLFVIDPDTLALTMLGKVAYSPSLTSVVGGEDYLQSGSELYATDGKTLRVAASDITAEGWKNTVVQDENEFALSCKRGFFIADRNGERAIPAEAEETAFALRGGNLVTQQVGAAETVLRNRDTQSGKALDTLHVENDCQSTENRIDLAPRLLGRENEYFWGEVGLYCLQNGRFSQIMRRPTVDCVRDEDDGSLVILTFEEGERPYYTSSAVLCPAGREIARVDTQGKFTLLLDNKPEHGITIDRVRSAAHGQVVFEGVVVMGMGDEHSTIYRLHDNGKIEIPLNEPGTGSAETKKLMQAELDARGVGIGAKPSTAPETVPKDAVTIYKESWGEVKQSVRADCTILVYCDPATGKIRNGFTIPYTGDAPNTGVQVSGNILWGEAGLFRVEGILRRLSERPTVDFASSNGIDNPAHNYSTVIVTREPGSAAYPLGDELIRVFDDGREELVLGAEKHGIVIDKAPTVTWDDILYFTGTPQGSGTYYTYTLKDGVLRVESAENWQAYFSGEDEALSAERTRLRKLGF